MKIRRFMIALFAVLSLWACANDLKGEKGDPGETGAPGDITGAIAMLHRPGYRTTLDDLTKVSLAASTKQPAKVYISGTAYQATADVTCVVTVAGRRGMEDGSSLKAATLYYLYAIPPESGGAFELTASEKAPTAGPSSFADWSYLGAFRTKAGNTDIHPFLAEGGRVQSTSGPFEAFTESSAALVRKSVLVPPAASGAFVEISATGSTAVAVLSVDGATDLLHSGMAEDKVVLLAPIFISQSLWLRVAVAASGLANLKVLGWIEDPTKFQ